MDNELDHSGIPHKFQQFWVEVLTLLTQFRIVVLTQFRIVVLTMKVF